LPVTLFFLGDLLSDCSILLVVTFIQIV